MMRIYRYFLILFLLLGCSSTKSPSTHSIAEIKPPAQETFFYDFDHFFGDKVALQDKSNHIKQLYIKLNFPPKHKFISETKSRIRLFTKDKLIDTFFIDQNEEAFTIEKKIEADKVYAELNLYYCREGAQGLCLMKNVLYEISLNPNLSPNDLTLNYTIPDEP